MKNNLYSICCDQVSTRFRDFYRSFETVMGAQITISSSNRVDRDLPHRGWHASRAVAHRGHFSLRARADCRQLFQQHDHHLFRFDDIPEAGDFCAGLSHRDSQARVFAKQQNHRRPNSEPVWLTLIALILGERLMGIPGLILAPVVLNYLRVEMLTVEVPARHEEVEVLSR